MSPIQQMLLGVGAVATKTYVDDIFSTYLWTGNGSARSINNGIDLSSEGGMSLIRLRNDVQSWHVYDTERGANKRIQTQSNAVENTGTQYLTSFNSNGFSLGTHSGVNQSNLKYASWSFRKAPGFFDVVKYTGNSSSSSQTISHSLGCVPGMIIVKSLSNTESWSVYHRELNGGVNPANYILLLDSTSGENASSSDWNNTAPTSSSFTVGIDGRVNGSGDYIAYLFAGGESTAATARSVDFDGSNDYLYTSTSHSDVSFGTGNFTIEFWFRYDGSSLTSTNDTLIDTRNGNSGGNADHGWNVFVRTNGHLAMFTNGSDGYGYAVESNTVLSVGQWYHAAITRSGDTYRLFLNGDLDNTNTQSSSADAGSNFYIGYKANYSASTLTYWNGLISNVRILKGTALYTSSFRPPTEPLTNITNTKFLWAQSSTVTTGTVNPMTLTNSGTTASTDSPFDDPAGFVFGENEDQNVIKCGSYVGSGSAGLEVNLGFEPQWVMFKASDRAAEWSIVDCMRGIVTGGNDAVLYPSEADAEVASSDIIEVSATGFRLKTTNQLWNQDTKNYIFTAIRRSDGYVGKPPELGTGVFAMDVGHGTSTLPNMDSGFPVDFSLTRTPASTSWPWFTGARLTGNKYLLTYATNAEQTATDWVWDNNEGWMKGGNGNTVQSWMWKRHAGFDCICIKGDGASLRGVPHSLNKTVEMAWVKRRNSTANWHIYHKGLNGGSSPEGYRLMFTNAAEASTTTHWANTAPTSTHFFVGANAGTNNSDDDYLMMLFASTDVSKVGYYDGSDSTLTITTGFQPRFLIIKNITTSNTPWYVLDTTRGWTSSGGADDNYLQLNTTDAQTNYGFGAPTSTGFNLVGAINPFNASGENYIYYAHA